MPTCSRRSPHACSSAKRTWRKSHGLTQRAPRRGTDYLGALEGDLSGLRIAYSNNLGYVDVDPDIERACAAAVDVFRDLGATVVEVDPGFSNPLAAFGHLFYGGAANACRDLTPRQRELFRFPKVGDPMFWT